MAAINPNLTPTTYASLKPGDRVILWPLNPTRPDAHQRARTVAEIVHTYRDTGFDDHGESARTRFTYYDHTVIEWRDTNGSLFTSRADDTVYTVTSAVDHASSHADNATVLIADLRPTA